MPERKKCESNKLTEMPEEQQILLAFNYLIEKERANGQLLSYYGLTEKDRARLEEIVLFQIGDKKVFTWKGYAITTHSADIRQHGKDMCKIIGTKRWLSVHKI